MKKNSCDTKMAFHFPHVSILGTHNCGKERHYLFKLRGNLHDFLCRRDYSERVVSILLIKPNHNIMVTICLYILKALN